MGTLCLSIVGTFCNAPQSFTRVKTERLVDSTCQRLSQTATWCGVAGRALQPSHLTLHFVITTGERCRAVLLLWTRKPKERQQAGTKRPRNCSRVCEPCERTSKNILMHLLPCSFYTTTWADPLLIFCWKNLLWLWSLKVLMLCSNASLSTWNWLLLNAITSASMHVEANRGCVNFIWFLFVWV